MSPQRGELLDIIYEDDETDEGAVSADCGTSLHGHPDHEHADEDFRALAAENELLRENVAELVREVDRADAEMVRWRSRCRKIEDERDALSRELDRCKAELERRHTRPQPMVVYSTTESASRVEQQPPVYRTANSPDAGKSPPLRFASPRMHALPPGASQPYPYPGLPAIAVSPSREPTPPGVGVPTHRGRLAPPRTSLSPNHRGSERDRKRERNRREQTGQNLVQERGRNHPSWELSRVDSLSPSQRFEISQREAQLSQREFERAQQEWEHVQFPREQDRPSPIVYSTGVPEEWNYFDIPRQNDGWNVAQSPYLAPTSRPASLSPPVQTPLVYSSAYPHPNGHGRGRHVPDEGSPISNPGHQDVTTRSPPQTQENTQSSLNAQMQLQLQHQQHQQQHQQKQQPPAAPEAAEPHSTPADGTLNTPLASACSSSSTSSAGSHEAPLGEPQTPPDPPPAPPPAPTTFTFSPTSPAFTPTGLRGFTPLALSPASTPFQPPTPVVDPEFGPVIVHGPLPPRHTQVSNAQAPAAAPQRRKREPAAVPPRHLAGGKAVAPASVFGGAAFGGAAMGMGGGVALALGGRGMEGEGAWTWERR